MAEFSKDNGKIIRWKVQEHSHGQMEDNIKENTEMIKKKEMVHFTGQMAENTKVIGQMVNSMVLEYTHQHQGKQRKDNGLKEKE